MTIERIRELCHAEPFVAFVLHMPDGRRIAVEHSDFVALAPSGRLMVVIHPDDSQSVVDVMLVSEVTIKSPKRRAATHRATQN